MTLPAQHPSHALIIHMGEGATDVVRLLQQQGYELIEQHPGPALWRHLGEACPDVAHLDLTRSTRSGALLFLRTIARLRTEEVLIDQFADAAHGGAARHGHTFRLRRSPAPTATARNGRGRDATPAASPNGKGGAPAEDAAADPTLLLAAGLAHDASNFLTVAVQCAALLQGQNLTGESRALVQDIVHASDRASALMRQLSGLCRRELAAPSACDLNQVIREGRRLLARLLGEDISLEVDLHAGPCPVRVNRRQAEQVLLNLAVNARDAMPHGGALLVCTSLESARAPAHGNDRSRRWVVLTVRDNGCGMTDAVKSHLFEPFFTTRAAGGVGLATVERIVQSAGGHIEVDSTPGCGSAFRVYWPEAAD